MSPRPLFLTGRVPVLRAARITEQHWKRQKTQPIVAVYFKMMRNEVGLHLHYITVEYLVVEKILSCRPVLLPSSIIPPSIFNWCKDGQIHTPKHTYHSTTCMAQMLQNYNCLFYVVFKFKIFLIQDTVLYSLHTCSVVLFYQNQLNTPVLCALCKKCASLVVVYLPVLPLIHSV